METLKRPLLLAHLFAALVALGGTSLFLASQAKAGMGWLAWIRDWFGVSSLDAAAGASPFAVAIAVAMAVLALSAGAAAAVTAAARLKRPGNS